MVSSFNFIAVRKYENIIKYSIVGVMAFVVDFSVFYAAITFIEFNYLIAGMCGFMVGVFVNYILARKYVFHHSNRVKKTVELVGVYAISAVGLIIHQVAIYILVEFVNEDVFVSKAIASIIVLLWNYNARRIYIYSG